MSNSVLTHKTLKNASYSFINYLWSFGFALFITPVLVFNLGVDNYGVYIFVGIVASLTGLIDLGLSTAVFKYLSEYSGSKNKDNLKKIIGSANILFLFVGVIGFIFLLSVGYFGEYFISNTVISTYNLKTIFLISGLTFFVNAIESVFVIIPRALQRYDVNTKIGFFSSSLPLLSVLLVVVLGYGLEVVFLVQLLFSIIFFIVYYFISRKLLPIANFYFKWNKKEVKNLYRFGTGAFITNISGQTLSYFDKLIIPIFLNPASLSHYSLSGSVASKSTGALNSINNVIFPVVSSLRGEKNDESIKNLYIKSFRLSTILNAAMTFSICIFSYEIMKYWLSDGIAQIASGILFVLGITYFFVSLQDQLTQFLFGFGKSKLLAKYSLLITALNIALLFILLPKFGIMGAAIAYLCSFIPLLYIIYYIEKVVLKLENRFNFYIKFISKIVFIGFIFFVITNYLFKPLINSFVDLLVIGPISVIMYLLLFYLFGFLEEDDKKKLKYFLIEISKKVKKIIKK